MYHVLKVDNLCKNATQFANVAVDCNVDLDLNFFLYLIMQLRCDLTQILKRNKFVQNTPEMTKRTIIINNNWLPKTTPHVFIFLFKM